MQYMKRKKLMLVITLSVKGVGSYLVVHLTRTDYFLAIWPQPVFTIFDTTFWLFSISVLCFATEIFRIATPQTSVDILAHKRRLAQSCPRPLQHYSYSGSIRHYSHSCPCLLPTSDRASDRSTVGPLGPSCL